MNLRENANATIKRYATIFIGTMIMAISTNMFFISNNIVAGGFTGIGIIAESTLGIKVSTVNVVLNIPLFIIALKILGRRYVVDTIMTLAVFTAVLEAFTFIPQVKDDMLLAAVFGGITQGLGTGLVLKGRGSTGGVDLLALLLHGVRRTWAVSVVMFVVNSIIIIGGMYFFGLNSGMYAIISVFITSKVANMVTTGLFISKTAVIISDRSDEISDALLKKLHRGVTFLRGRGAYTGRDKEVLLCVFSQKETITLTDIVKKTDPKSFIIILDANIVLGSGFKNIETMDIM